MTHFNEEQIFPKEKNLRGKWPCFTSLQVSDVTEDRWILTSASAFNLL